VKRIQHAQKVARFAEEMVKKEGGNPLVVLGSAYLHDIGIQEAEKKHGNSSGEFQELEGPPIAKDLLKRIGLQTGMIEEICDIIGHHHHPREEETLNFQILYEADWLVNIEEDGISKDREKLEELTNKVFQTVTGKKFAEDLYLNPPAKN
jgi:HD superfamily phosphodiesterase